MPESGGRETARLNAVCAVKRARSRVNQHSDREEGPGLTATLRFPPDKPSITGPS